MTETELRSPVFIIQNFADDENLVRTCREVTDRGMEIVSGSVGV
jgi:hypothetical protein